MALTAAELALVAKAPLLAGLSSADLAMLMEGAHATQYPEAELLFNQGDKADRFFVLLEGRVNVFALTETGDQSIIEVFDPIVSFAEAAIFSSAVRWLATSSRRIAASSGALALERITSEGNAPAASVLRNAPSPRLATRCKRPSSSSFVR